MSNALKKRIAFAMLMGVVTTGLMSFLLLGFNVGFPEHFVRIWLRSWAVGYAIIIPAILIIGPGVEALVGRMIPPD